MHTEHNLSTSSTNSAISVIGLGAMGSQITKRLLDTGHTVAVFNRSPEPVQEALRFGATELETVARAFEHPVVISMLANDEAALQMFSRDTLDAAREMSSKSIHINMATLSTNAAEQLTERHAAAGIRYIAAPVLGRPPVAASGQLNIMAGGDHSVIEQVQPLLDVIGKRTWVVGDTPRSANLVKIAANFNLIHVIEALGESIALVESGGVDAELFVDLLTNSAFGGGAYTGYGAAIATRNYYPAGFPIALGKKDLGLVEQVAEEHGLVLPTVAALHDVFEQALAREDLAGADWSAVAEIARAPRTAE
jgi:3-hydroxyisobutyrate dehydrogenase-like beta-hydroxyacid dehydrogenase